MGGEGTDTLIGGNGDDTFVIDGSLAGSSYDTIIDFDDGRESARDDLQRPG